jgi:hypothetical protein
METATPGPAGGWPVPPEVALPRVAKMPAPMIAPMPRAMRSTAVSAFLRLCSPSPPSAMSAERVQWLAAEERRHEPPRADGGKDAEG